MWPLLQSSKEIVMKQIGRYSKFLFSIIFRRWSYYVSTLVYLLVLIAVLFLVSAVMKQPVSITLMYYGFNMMVVLAGAIVAAIYAVQLFRAGIDDGTELLITAKPIKRNEMLVGKCIVLATLILLLSLLSMCFGFLTYFTVDGYKTYTYVGGGVFLTTLLILLFFSGVALVFCLVTKKMGATLATIGTCFAFMLYCFADTILSSGPAKYVQNKNVDIKILNPVLNIENVQDDQYTYQVMNGAIARNKLTNTAISFYKNNNNQIVPANGDYLANLWHEALLGSSRYSMLVFDPIFQWSELMNLQNYIVDDYQAAYFYKFIFNQDTVTNGNLRFGKKPIDFNQFKNWSINVNQDVKIKYLLLENNDFNFSYGNQSFQVPSLIDKQLSWQLRLPTWTPWTPKDQLNEVGFGEPIQINNPHSWEKIDQFLFETQPSKPPKIAASKAIVDSYAQDFQTLISSNMLSNMNHPNTVSYVQSYLNQAVIASLNNPKILAAYQQYIQANDWDLELKNLNDLAEVFEILMNNPQDLIKQFLFVNKISLSILKQMQQAAYEYVVNYSTTNYQDPKYVHAMNLLELNSLIPTIVTSYSSFIMPYEVMQTLIQIGHGGHLNQELETLRQISKLVNLSMMRIDQPPLMGMNESNFATFNTVAVTPYLTLGGVLGVWFSLTAILLVIGTILYARKDFI